MRVIPCAPQHEVLLRRHGTHPCSQALQKPITPHGARTSSATLRGSHGIRDDREELFAREDANARTSKFLSWFAKANHPRLSLQMSRRKSRGWSAYADHDKRGSMLECDDLRAFAFSRAIKSAVFNAIWRSSRRLSLPRLFGKIQQRLPVPHLLAASVLPGKKPRRL